MKLPSLSLLAQAFVHAANRFPATMLCALVGVGALMTAIEQERNDPENIIKVWLMAQLGLALCTGLTVLAESLAWNQIRSWALQALGLAALVVYYFLFDMHAARPETMEIPRYMGLLAAAHLLVAVAPYLNRLSVADFWEFNKRLFANFIVGAVYTLILYVGLALALLAVNELFNLNIDGKMYAHLFVLLAGIFQTTFFLFHLPATFEFEEQEKSYNAVFKNLCQYILIPIVGLYFLILYAYSIKILVTWNLPQGWVSSLVLGFSVAGIFTYLLNYLLPNYSDSKIVAAYRKWFWWVLLPMVGLLFVAIGRRIGDYGITEQRFYVAHAGVWLLAMCVYFLRSKTDNIKFIPISLGLFCLLAVLGPFSAFNVAERNQTSILKNLLEKNDRFEGDKLKTGGTAMPLEDAQRVSSSLEFLAQRNALDRIDAWFPVPLDSILQDTGKYAYYQNATDLAEWLNAIPADQPYAPNKIISVYPLQQIPLVPMSGNIAGFRAFYRLEMYEGQSSRKTDPKTVRFSNDMTALLLYAQNGKTAQDSFDLKPLMQTWAAGAAGKDYYPLPDSAQVFELKSLKSTGRLYLQEARFDSRKKEMLSLNGLLFVK